MEDLHPEEAAAPARAPEVGLRRVEVEAGALLADRLDLRLVVVGLAGDEAPGDDAAVALLDRHAVVAGRDVAAAVVHRHDLRLVAGRVVLDTVEFHRELPGRHDLRQVVADVRLVAVDGRAPARRERHAADDQTDRGASRQRIVQLAGHVVGEHARAERRSGRPRAVDGALAGAGAPVEARRRLQVGGHVEGGVVRTFGDVRLGGDELVVARHVRCAGRLEVRVVRDLELVGARSHLIGRRLADDQRRTQRGQLRVFGG